MHIALPNNLEEYVTSLVQTCGYAQPSEVIAEALREHRTRRDGVEIVMTPQLEVLLDAGLENLAQAKTSAELRRAG
jgi:Arc/MetJ-type ribon-helix-helix transcriptional regulator